MVPETNKIIKNIVINGVNMSMKGTTTQPLLQDKDIEINTVGITEVTPDEGYDGLAKVNINVTANDSKFEQLTNGTLTEITAEDLQGVTKINDYAFYRQVNLKKVKLPNTIEVIGENAFNGCTLIQDIDFSNVHGKISYGCFNNLTNLKSLNLKNITGAVEVRNDSAGFIINCTKLQYVNLENYSGTANKLIINSLVAELYMPKLQTIDDRAFESNKQLKTLYFKALTRIQQRFIFSGCDSLKKIIIANKDTICIYAPASSGNIPSSAYIYVPLHLTLTPEDDNVASYRQATNWVTYASKIFPLLDNIEDFSSVDTSLYTKCCIDDRENDFPIYNYTNGEWVKE